MPTTVPNRLSVGVATPVVNPAAFTVQPMQILQAFDAGRQVVGSAMDDIIVRPAQRADAAQLARENVRARPTLTDNAISSAAEDIRARPAVADATIANAEYAKETANRGVNLLKDPTYRVKAARSQIDAIENDKILIEQEMDQLDGTDPEYIDKFKKLANKRASLVKDFELAKTNYMLEEAGINTASKTAQAGAVRANTDLGTANFEQSQQPVVQAGVASANQTAAANAQTAQGLQPIVAATAEAQAASALAQARFGREVATDPALQGVARQTVDAQAILGLAQLKSQLALLGSGGPIDETMAKQMEKMGIPTMDASGRRVTGAEASQLITQKQNRVDAEKDLATIRAGAEGSAALGEAAQGILDAVNTGVGTGYLYGWAPVKAVDLIFAQMGAEGSQARERMAADGMKFIAETRKSFPGQVSNFEMALYRQANPGPQASPATNKALANAFLAISQRNKDRARFFDNLVGPMTYQEVSDEWENYLEVNPVLQKTAGGPVTFNANRISPEDWMAAKSGSAGMRGVMQKQLASIAEGGAEARNALPVGSRVGPRTTGPEKSPWLIIDNQIVPNDDYWTKLLVK